jgi:hypothetical protein
VDEAPDPRRAFQRPLTHPEHDAVAHERCQPGDATTHLVGPMTGRAGPQHLVVESVDDADLAELYRRIGFVDEVYWYQRYVLVC